LFVSVSVTTKLLAAATLVENRAHPSHHQVNSAPHGYGRPRQRVVGFAGLDLASAASAIAPM